MSRRGGRRTSRPAGSSTLAGVLAAALLVLAGCSGAQDAGSRGPLPTIEVSKWRLDLSEDFDRLDPGVWNVRDGESYERDLARVLAGNVSVRDGQLRVQARPESVAGRMYTTGDLDTYDRYSLPQYFRAEVRARVPLEHGMWAAPLWIRPADRSEGEIDLVETYGGEQDAPRIHQSIHGRYGSPRQVTSVKTPFSQVGGRARGWHTYVVEKTPGQVVMSVDGQETARFGSGDPEWFEEYYESGMRWSLRISLQVGGSDVTPDETTRWSGNGTTMLVDRVRTWVPAD